MSLKLRPIIQSGRNSSSILKNIIARTVQRTSKSIPESKARHFGKGLTVSINLVSQNEIKRLNRKFRSKNKATDVLAFPQFIPGMNTYRSHLGDILICPQIARLQAKKFGKSFQWEMANLTAHGLLHLLGYDHEQSKRDEKIMFRLQDEIIKTLRLLPNRRNRIQSSGRPRRPKGS